MIFGLLYTHHKVPDAVLRAMLDSVRMAGLPDHRLVVVSNRPDPRFPRTCWNIGNDNSHTLSQQHGWIPAIYEQMETGLSQIPPGSTVCFLEHDVLYPACYFDVIADRTITADRTYFWTPYWHIDLNPARRPGGKEEFWNSDTNGTYTVASGTIGKRQWLLDAVQHKQHLWETTRNVGVFEPGIGTAEAPLPIEFIADYQGRPLPPNLDIRTGANTTATWDNGPARRRADYDPYWGHAAHWHRRFADLTTTIP